jgi:uncharacterized membrane protein YiaA
MPVLGLLVMVTVCFFIGVLGRDRKLGFWGYFFASLLLTPVIGMLLVVATDPRKEEKEEKPRKVFKFGRKENIIEGIKQNDRP